MPRRTELYEQGANFVEKNNHLLAQTLISGAVALGIVDDFAIPVVGLLDNPFMGAASAVVAGLALRTTESENDSRKRKAVKSVLGIAVAAMMFDDATGALVLDNPFALAGATALTVMNFNDWRHNR